MLSTYWMYVTQYVFLFFLLQERFLGTFLNISNYVFTVIFVSEMTVKV